MSRSQEVAEAIEREAQEWPGVTIAFGRGAKHPFATLTFRGMQRKLSFPGTTANRRAADNQVRDLRRLLRDMGAARRECCASAREHHLAA